MNRYHWTAGQLEQLRQLYADHATSVVAAAIGRTEKSVYQKAKELGIRKSAAFLASTTSGRIQRGQKDPRMVSTQFKPSSQPWNKGVQGSTGLHPNCRATQFKPGQPPKNTTLPLGSYRINKDGHLQQKVTELPGNNSKRWRGVAELVWCKANGPLPPKHIVVFKPGMKTSVLEEITLDRVECISLAENARRNHPRNKHPEYARLVQLRGAITRQVNRINREAQEATA